MKTEIAKGGTNQVYLDQSFEQLRTSLSISASSQKLKHWICSQVLYHLTSQEKATLTETGQ